MKLRTAVALIAITVASISIACSGSSTDSGDSPLEARITVDSGGELRSSDGSFVLTVPPGAVSEDVTISVDRRAADEATNGVSDAEGDEFELKPDGLQFLTPATVSLKLSFDDLSIDSESGATPVFDLLTVSSDGQVSGLDNVANEFDVATGELVLSGELSHFSKMVRTKQKLKVSLEQVEPLRWIVGTQIFPVGAISERDSPLSYDLTWVAEGRGKLKLDNARSTLNPSGMQGVFKNDAVTQDDDGIFRVTATRFLNEGRLGLLFTFTCTGEGSGVYSLNVKGNPQGTIEKGLALRQVRISLQGNVLCVDSPAGRATVTAVAGATRRAGALDIQVTPTPPGFVECEDSVSTPAADECEAGQITLPTPSPIPFLVVPTPIVLPPTVAKPTKTPVPTIGRSDEKLRLVVMASSGDSAPGANSKFTEFELPSAGGNFSVFHGFTENGASGVWSFEEDELIGATLDLLATSTSPPKIGTLVYIQPELISITQSGLSSFIARFKDDSDFVDSVYLADSSRGSIFSPVAEGDDAAGRESGTTFTQFYSVQATESTAAVFRAVAGVEGFWLWNGEQNRLLVSKGQALPGLSSGWKPRGSSGMVSAGVLDDGEMLFFVGRYFRSLPDDQDEKGSGLWLLSSLGNSLIVQSGMTLPDTTIVTLIGSPSINRKGDLAFIAVADFDGGFQQFTNRAIWKTDSSAQLVKVAEEGSPIASAGMKLVEVSSPLILPDGRVAFVGQVFDDTNSLISLVLVESDNGLEVLARTDALPWRNEELLSEVPSAIRKLSVNSSGHVAFEIGLGESIWMQSPGGHVHRVIGIGDTLDVPGSNGPATKTVTFVEYLGGANTGTGVPTAFSDSGNLAIKVTFLDNSESVVYATFDEAPVVQ